MTLDLGARHPFRRYLSGHGRIRVVTNRSYRASVHPSSINEGGAATNNALVCLPRICHFTLEVDF
ncbi:hypothetical protein [Gluconacetobacter tumulisoli]|uniref:Uncharacterized protein n=1 Tax=Gluconacetobacter tumulisoli TaxID=1286189 RepID=A0A7W4K6P1_9PROT|nr:hypothetical protein [Gluconacetobacter tumulisoli]MBB2201372.1 hypothetical protein [Gluconacetobacter tumulisoli]